MEKIGQAYFFLHIFGFAATKVTVPKCLLLLLIFLFKRLYPDPGGEIKVDPYPKHWNFYLTIIMINRNGLQVPVSSEKSSRGYYLRSSEDPSYFPGRAAEIVAYGQVPVQYHPNSPFSVHFLRLF